MGTASHIQFIDNNNRSYTDVSSSSSLIELPTKQNATKDTVLENEKKIDQSLHITKKRKSKRDKKDLSIESIEKIEKNNIETTQLKGRLTLPLDQSSSSFSSEIGPQKEIRNRKRKSVTVSECDNFDSISVCSEIEPKTQGRKRKTVSKFDDINSISVCSEVGPKIQGRKRKTVSKFDDFDSISVCSEVEPKTQGRKRKTVSKFDDF